VSASKPEGDPPSPASLGIVRKRRQHHVWQQYLRAWATDGAVFCLQNDRIESRGTSVVAVEKDFYKLADLADGDLAVIRFLAIDGANAIAKPVHENFLRLLMRPGLMLNALKAKGADPALIDELLDITRTNILEEYQTLIENNFGPLLDIALSGDLSFYDRDDDCMSFALYIATQYMRTKGIKTKVVELVLRKNNLDLSRTWDILAHIFATNIASTIYVARKRQALVLLRNETSVPFITGDQPVINLHAATPAAADKLVLYYPLSPHLALVLCELDEPPPLPEGPLSEATVADLNRRIVKAAHRQVFGDTEAALLASKELALADGLLRPSSGTDDDG